MAPTAADRQRAIDERQTRVPLEFGMRITAGRTKFTCALDRVQAGDRLSVVLFRPRAHEGEEQAAALAHQPEIERLCVINTEIDTRRLKRRDVSVGRRYHVLRTVCIDRTIDLSGRRITLDQLADDAAGILYLVVAKIQNVGDAATSSRDCVVYLDVEVVSLDVQPRNEAGAENGTEGVRLGTLLLQVGITKLKMNWP